ncbi:MAG: transposase [Chloroflexota bacterium]|nr:MAG: transposase [Chloroflexota bacterium]
MPMSKHRRVTLITEDRERLEQIIHSGDEPARTQMRARILLLTDYSQGNHWTDEAIAAALLCSQKTVVNVRQRYVEEGLEAALYDKPRPGQTPKLTGEVEAKLILLACSDPPEGYARWTMRLLADKLVELEVVEEISHVAVWERLKKTNCTPGG